jgi:hypothetical protein
MRGFAAPTEGSLCARASSDVMVKREQSERDSQAIEDMLALGRRVRERLRAVAHEIDALPEEEGPVAIALVTWRVALLIMSWDVADGALSLGEARGEHIRAIHMLNRSLFEYAIRLEYYAYTHREAVKDWVNAEAWLKMIVKGTDAADMATWNREERHAYNQMIKVEGEFEYPSLPQMLQRVFRGRGYSKNWRRNGLKTAGRFYSMQENFAPAKLHFRSYRVPELLVVRLNVHYLIQVLYAESIHRGEDLGCHMYWRELELIHGEWDPSLPTILSWNL